MILKVGVKSQVIDEFYLILEKLTSLLIFLCCLSVTTIHATPHIDIKKKLGIIDQPSQALKGYIEYKLIPNCDLGSIDSCSPITIDSIMNMKSDGSVWKVVEDDIPNFGFSTDTLWLRFSLSNLSSKPIRRIIEISNPLLDSIIIYELTRDEISNKFILGDRMTFSHRILNHRYFLLPISMQATEERDYYIEIRTSGALTIPTQIWRQADFTGKDQISSIGYGIFFGIMLAMFIYNLFLYASIKKNIYLYYSLYIISFLTIQLIISGFAFQYLWPYSVFLQNWGQGLFIASTGFFLNLFCLNFLEIKFDISNKKIENIIFILFSMISLLYFLQIFILLIDSALIFIQYLIIPNCLLAVFAGIRQLYCGLRSARFFILGWGFFLFGVMGILFDRLGIIADLPYIEVFPLVGAVFEAMFFSVGLADRINSFRAALYKQNIELVKNQSKLESAKHSINKVMAAIPGSVVIINKNFYIESANKFLYQLLGYEIEDDLEGKKLEYIMGDVSSADFQSKFWDDTQPLLMERNYISKQGALIPVLFSRALIDEDGHRRAVCIAQDLSDQKSSEERLRQSMKFRTVSTLAGGIAHNINNILMPIIGNTELLQEDILDKKSVEYRLLESIKRAGNRGAELVSQLLRFCGHMGTKKNHINFDLIMQRFIEKNQNRLLENTDFQYLNDSESADIIANASLLEQALTNIITNSLQAIDKKANGRISIIVKKLTLDQKLLNDLQVNNVSAGRFLEVSIIDNGVGMDESTACQIFDPFFTTRSVDQGTGLGLSVALGIIHEHSGDIVVDTEVDKGTKLSIYLPIARKVDDSVIAHEVASSFAKRQGHILLVDDEEMILFLLEQALSKQGFIVTTENNAENALQVYEKLNDSIDLVITDNTMPGMMGAEFAKNLLAINSELPIIIITGSSIALTEEQSKSIGIAEYFLKPVDINNLMSVVNKYLRVAD